MPERSWADEWSLPSAAAARIVYKGATDLGTLRRVCIGVARDVGLPREVADRLALVVTELASNTVRHTRCPGVLTLWPESGGVVAQIEDSGVAEAMSSPPELTASWAGIDRGLGLFIVWQLADFVRIRGEPPAVQVLICAC